MIIEADLSCYDIYKDLTGFPVTIGGFKVGEVIEDYAGLVTMRIYDRKAQEKLGAHTNGGHSIGFN